jgi:hypothetical protein
MSTSTNNHIPYVPQNTLDPAAGLNDAINVIDALLNTRVTSMDLTVPPSSPADGEMYIAGSGATGDWSGHDNAFARWVEEGTFWQFYEAGVEAWLVLNKDDGNLYKWNQDTSAWEQAAGIGEAPLDGKYYGRQNASWSAMPNVSEMVTSVNDKTIDSSGNVEVSAGDVPFSPDTNSSIQSNNVAGAIEELSDGKADLGLLAGFNVQSGPSYTLQLSDRGKEIKFNGGSDLVIPPDVLVPFPIGTQIAFAQDGSSAVNAVAGGTDVDLIAPNGASTTAIGDARVIVKEDTDTWRIW